MSEPRSVTTTALESEALRAELSQLDRSVRRARRIAGLGAALVVVVGFALWLMKTRESYMLD